VTPGNGNGPFSYEVCITPKSWWYKRLARRGRQAIYRRLRHGTARAVLLAGVLLIVLPGAARAYSTAPGFTASDYATGFPEKQVNRWGPIGIAFDTSDNLYVADTVDGNIYRFQPGGGVASDATRVTASPVGEKITGLLVAPSGQLYLARYGENDVVQVDPDTGQVVRTIANVQCATGLAIDPISGDLFVSENGCGNTIWRVSNYQSGPGTASPYSSAPYVDGLAFDTTSGTLYAESGGHVLKIAGTHSSTPGQVESVATVPQADGLAFGAHSSGEPPYLVTNRNNGTVTRVDFASGLRPTSSDIFSGGSRGDFAAVDSNGCLYVTQSSSVVRIARDGQPCGLQPTTAGPAPRAGVVLGARGACVRIASLRLRIRQRGRVRLRSATVYVNGHRVRRLGPRGVTGWFTLRHLPRSAFTVKITAITSRGRALVTRRRFTNCAKPPPRKCKAPVRLGVPRRPGAHAFVVDVYINGRHVRRLRRHIVGHVILAHPPRRAFRATLIAHYNRPYRGARATSHWTFPACSR